MSSKFNSKVYLKLEREQPLNSPMSYQRDKNYLSKFSISQIMQNYLPIFGENKVENRYFSPRASGSYQDKDLFIISTEDKYPKCL